MPPILDHKPWIEGVGVSVLDPPTTLLADGRILVEVDPGYLVDVLEDEVLQILRELVKTVFRWFLGDNIK